MWSLDELATLPFLWHDHETQVEMAHIGPFTWMFELYARHIEVFVLAPAFEQGDLIAKRKAAGTLPYAESYVALHDRHERRALMETAWRRSLSQQATLHAIQSVAELAFWETPLAHTPPATVKGVYDQHAWYFSDASKPMVGECIAAPGLGVLIDRMRLLTTTRGFCAPHSFTFTPVKKPGHEALRILDHAASVLGRDILDTWLPFRGL